MQTPRLAAQLYTIRDFVKTVPDFANSVARVRQMGYAGIQLDWEHHPEVPPTEIKRIAEDQGLTICIAHFAPQLLWNELEQIVEWQQIWGCPHVALPYPPAWVKAEGEAGYLRLARELTNIGRRLFAQNISLSYHNHSAEFVRFGQRTGLDILFDESDARYLLAELDTYWIQHGGADPVTWIRRLKGRMPVVHYKDMRMDADGTQKFAEVGSGNLNWTAILKATLEANVDWIVVEQDFCDRNPFDSLRVSHEFLAELLLQQQ